MKKQQIILTMHSESVSWLRLQGCRQHNLKNINLSLPKLTLIAITGLSGSGKSSFAFDTLFAEGQRRYLEYLSSHTKEWLNQTAKPDIDFIEGLSPTLAVGQKRPEFFARGTIATYTDIYDLLAVLYAKVGVQHSPATGKPLIRHTRQEMIQFILEHYATGSKIQLLSPIKLNRENAHQAIARLQLMGYQRMKMNGEEWTSDSPLPALEEISQLDAVIDRLEMKEGIRERLAASIETALDLSHGILKIQEGRQGSTRYLTEIYVCPETSLAFPPLIPVDFNFNSPRGACPTCRGQGGQLEVDPSLILKKRAESIEDQVINLLNYLPKKIALPFEKIFHVFLKTAQLPKGFQFIDLPPEMLDKLLFGSSQRIELFSEGTESIDTAWQGLVPFLNRVLKERSSRSSLVNSPFVKWNICPACKGGRLKPESLACLLQGKSISALCSLTVSQLIEEIEKWSFGKRDALIAKDILLSLLSRLYFLKQVGLDYLELDRSGHSLSSGESKRVQLASQIGAKLSGLIYILDEPSLGLHRQDIHLLKEVLQELKNLGNTVCIVEHERDLIKMADHIIEFGPGAGKHGGSVVFQGGYQELLKDRASLTGQWLSGRKSLPSPSTKKGKPKTLSIKNASLHHLHDFSVSIPLNRLVGLCGVSGSGKSTLAIDLIGKPMAAQLNAGVPVEYLRGWEGIKKIVIGQKPAERSSSRSIPATYINIMTPIRQLFAETRLAKARGYLPSRFSLNKRGGRCDTCEGIGELRVNMELMPDLHIPCDACLGTRYNFETLQITWEQRNIAEVLALSAEEAALAFKYIPSIAVPLQLMQELGLGYLTLGQPFNTLSGGEVQRLRLVGDLLSSNYEPTLYILDEPSAGLHFEDLHHLIAILHRLVDQGHSVIIIEHHLDMLLQCDWLIELGPGGGPAGGRLIFEGKSAQILKGETPTGIALQKYR